MSTPSATPPTRPPAPAGTPGTAPGTAPGAVSPAAPPIVRVGEAGAYGPGAADPAHLADAAGVEALLRCWVRETGVGRPADGVLRLDLAAAGVSVEAPVAYWSPCGWHRFGPARFAGGAPVDAVTLAALLAVEATARRSGRAGRAEEAGHGGRFDPAAVADLAGRVADSVRRVARYVSARRAVPACPSDSLWGSPTPAAPPGTTPFLAAEQALLLGHPLHPAPKSREGLTEAEDAAFAPELRGSFPLHWFAADPGVVCADSALDRPAAEILAALAGGELKLPPGAVAVPAHPWQARELLARPGVRALLAGGALRDLGPAGPAWSPTSSVRTVYRPDTPVMLKLSLGLRITNSAREHLRVELRRGVEVHRMLDAGLGAVLAAAHPGFGIVRDPAFLAVDVPGEGPGAGLAVVVRDNPFGPGERVGCVAGLVAERPDLPGGRSLLAALVHGIAARTGRAVTDVGQEWFARYLDATVVPVLWLYGAYGLGLEAHQQNTLVALDGEGWPAGGAYRDNQGYYFSASRGGRLDRWLPGAGRDLGTCCPDEVIDERLGYYVGVNNMLGVAGAMGAQRLADERTLLALARAALERLALERPATAPEEPPGRASGLVGTLLEAPTLRCKANLLTRVDGLDELAGPLAAQSVYVDIPNPLRDAAGPGRPQGAAGPAPGMPEGPEVRR